MQFPHKRVQLPHQSKRSDAYILVAREVELKYPEWDTGMTLREVEGVTILGETLERTEIRSEQIILFPWQTLGSHIRSGVKKNCYCNVGRSTYWIGESRDNCLQ